MSAKQPATLTSDIAFELDKGAGARARIGLLVLESDQTIEPEFQQLLNLDGVAVYNARLANDVQVTPEKLAQMEQQLPIAAALIPPYQGIKALGYGCTSASTVIGEERVASILDQAHPGVPSSNPLSAAKAAFGALGVTRIALLTPYTADVTGAMQQNFDDSGISVNVVGSFNQDSDEVVGKISPQSILDAVLDIGASPSCDGVFVSCTSMRGAGIIEEAERKLGKPVTTSNHALAWHLLRLAGIEDAVLGQGRLFHLPLSATQTVGTNTPVEAIAA